MVFTAVTALTIFCMGGMPCQPLICIAVMMEMFDLDYNEAPKVLTLSLSATVHYSQLLLNHLGLKE